VAFSEEHISVRKATKPFPGEDKKGVESREIMCLSWGGTKTPHTRRLHPTKETGKRRQGQTMTWEWDTKKKSWRGSKIELHQS